MGKSMVRKKDGDRRARNARVTAMKKLLTIVPGMTPGIMALRLAASYAALGVLWVVFSDALVNALPLAEPVARFIETSKGVLFVLVTATVMFMLARAGLSRVALSQASLYEQEQRIRDAYVDVLDAVTGGKLILVSGDEIKQELGSSLGEPVPFDDPAQLAAIRARIKTVAREEGFSDNPANRAISAVGEALNNALRHAGAGEYQVLRRDGVLQVKVADKGPGIDFKTLPKAMLVPGFSTAHTLGMGFTIMLQLSQRLLISTEPGSTVVVIECS